MPKAPKRKPPRGTKASRKAPKRQAAAVGGGSGASSTGESECESEDGAVVFCDEAEAARDPAEAARAAAAARWG